MMKSKLWSCCSVLLCVLLVNVNVKSYAQGNLKIRGTVVDAKTGTPLGGVSILDASTKNSTSTSSNGSFEIGSKTNSKLTFKYIGYESTTVSISNQTSLSIAMKEEESKLDEVVVVAFGTMKKKDFTGAVSSIGPETIEKSQVSTISRAFEGTVPGLQFSTNSGQPGADATLRIRGLGSLNASSNPLVVVDGSPSNVSLNSLNPADIESIVVSKDAAANALYGSRAANGLIIITTKKGKKGATSISADMRLGITSIGQSDFDKVTDPATYYEYTWQGIYNYVKYSPDRNASFKTMSDADLKKYAADNLFKANGNALSARNGLGNYMSYKIPDGTTLIDPTTGKIRPDAQLLYNDDWQDYFFKTPTRQEYNLSISGGSEKNDFFISLGYLDDPAYVMASNFDRYNARINVNSQINNWLKGGASLFYSRTNSDVPGYTGGTVNTNLFTWLNYFSPINSLFAHDEQGKIKYDQFGKTLFDLGTGETYSPYGSTARLAFNGYSPGIYFQKDYTNQKKDVLSGRTYLEATFLKDFKFKVDLALDNSYLFNKSYGNNESGTAARDFQGTIAGYWARGSQVNTTQLLTWNKQFAKHHVDALLGHEFRWARSDDQSGQKYMMLAYDKPTFNNAVGISYLNGTESSSTIEGYLSRFNYNYDEKYYLSASVRVDGSSFFRDNQWGTFWSVGGAYRLSQEKFLKKIGWINDLKIRGSLGVQGNNAVGANNWIDTWTLSNAGTLVTPVASLAQATWGNLDLSWETNNTYDIGLDFSFFNRLSGSFDYFNRDTKNLLFGKPLPASTGRSSRLENSGELNNKGFEIDLNYVILRNDNLRWSFGANASYYKTTLVSMPTGVGSKDLGGAFVQGNFLRGPGKDYYNLYLYKYAGVDQNTGLGMIYKTLKETDDFTKYPNNKVGDIVTTTGIDGTRYELGTSNPDLVGGFNTSINYKNFDFSIYASYQLGGKTVSLSYQGLTGNSIGRGIHTDLLDAWTPENKDSNIPMRMLGGTNYGSVPLGGGAGQYSDFALFDASYLNLKSMTLGYSFSQSLLSKYKIQKLRCYLAAENLFFISAKKGVDPRTAFDDGSSVGAFGYPQSRVVSFAINLTL
ncbi:SusC/RagA family TonB-linked outer membrane protein [Pedobacter hiemivivus]|uniref:SusC/RagA family TonB-linked outer membrane protein n=1 Tax=Pedobacter hiemivivus TaxID=2530454 RepID=A0A4R0NB66_9SPHI|nr:SusC/RagA family TonB-linked outer membrane protein [Pedobacter hiemivivus]TCC96493.1 SusC/RagA family TonB-linked outer membrane protein [Pedobacter hiemivivus]